MVDMGKGLVKNMRNHKKNKQSISRQYTGIFLLLMLGTILLCWFLNNTFLDDFYFRNKKTDLMKIYQSLNQASEGNELISDEYGYELQNLCARYNMDVLVLDVDSRMLRFAGTDLETTRLQLWENLLAVGGESKDAVIEQTNEFQISIVKDKRLKSENIEMWGNLNSGDYFLIRTPMESMQDSVKLSNKFLAYVGVLAAILSGIIVWVTSKRMTKPILELTDLSKRMAKLDFDARYNGKEKNEIAVLGENFNSMSASLESTISELKTANVRLTKEIEKKTEIDDMRKEFIANVSHELKTPIAIIQGYAEGLQEDIMQDAESRAYYCNVICDEAKKMNDMVQKLLTLNHLESGHDVVEVGRFDLVAMISSILESNKILFEQKQIHIIFNRKEPIYVWADEFLVEEVFQNYLSNAINHCAGKKEIKISIENTDRKVRVLCFNTGNNIPEESIDYVWDKFYKVDKARTREYGGSGIGLAIVKAIMDALGENYGVENQTDGVAFWFELDRQEKIEDIKE